MSVEGEVIIPQEAERAIVGAIMLDNDSYFRTCESLTAADFGFSQNRLIYRVAAEMLTAGAPVDLITISAELRARNQLKAAGGDAYLASLTEGLPMRSNIASYVEMVRDCSRRRRMIANAQVAIGKFNDRSTPLVESMGALEGSVLDLMSEQQKGVASTAPELARACLSEIDRIANESRDIVGLPSGIVQLDEWTLGLMKGEVTTVAAYTGGGKSAFAMNYAMYVAQQQKKVRVFSFEMRKIMITMRIVAAETGLNFHRLRGGFLSKQDREKVCDCLADFGKLPISIDDSPSLTTNELLARMRKAVTEGVELIVIDFIQRIIGADNLNERQVINQAVNKLADFSRATGVHIMQVSQLSRPKEQQRDPRPRLHQLKESGNIEQASDMVFLLYRPIDKAGEFTCNDEIIIAKNRSGATGKVKAYFKGPIMRWYPREEQMPLTSAEKAEQEAKEKKKQEAKPKGQLALDAKAAAAKDDDENF